MKFQIIFLIALLTLAQSQFLRRNLEDEAVNTDVNLDNVNTVVDNINTAIGLNQSGIVVLNNVNFGVIVQQIGEFAVSALDLAQIMEPALTSKQSNSNVDTNVVLKDINTVVNNINSAFAMNQSGVVVLKASNLGIILQQIGEFQTQAKKAIKKLKAEQVNTTENLNDVNTVVNNINTIEGMNQSGVVSVTNSNFGIIVQQIGEFAVSAAKKIAEASAPENNQNEYVDTRVQLSDIATVLNNINTAGGMNQSGIVVLDDVNFGVVVQQIGEFDTEKFASATQQKENKTKLSQAEEVNTEVDLSDINTVVNNINTAFGLNQSGIVVLNNVNFGVIVQQIGDFETTLYDLAEKAQFLQEQHQSKASSFFKKLIE